MTASEKLTQLIEHNKLTDEQQDSLKYWGIINVAELECFLIDKIRVLQFLDTHSINYKRTISALYTLLDYDDDDYVVYNESGLQKLDLDKLNNALGIDQKRGNKYDSKRKVNTTN